MAVLEREGLNWVELGFEKLGQDCVLKTCLSPRVYNILYETTNFLDTDYVCIDSANYLKGNILNLREICRLFPDQEDDSFEYFMNCTEAMKPVLCAIDNKFQNVSEYQLFHENKSLYSWTCSPEIVEDSMRVLQMQTSCSTVHALLLLTSLLERSLGNVYLLNGKLPCPSMLKDLLVTPELQHCFGTEAIKILRVCMGPPTSLNIRNVLWHGFPMPGEIHSSYGYFMFCLICTLGELLQSTGYCVGNREFIICTPDVVTVISSALPATDFNLKLLKKLFDESSFVMPQMLPFWNLSLQMFDESRYGEFCVLLLPQFEHGMRRLFGVINNCPERVFTAENTTLFTTFDEILSKKISETQTNKLYTQSELPYLMMLMDMLKYPDGLRLRDHISHGEMEIGKINYEIAAYVLAITTSICVHFLPKNSSLWKEDTIKSQHAAAMTYQTLFHPLAIISRQISTMSVELYTWQSIPCPDSMKTTVYPHQEMNLENAQYNAAMCWVVKHPTIAQSKIRQWFLIDIDDPKLLFYVVDSTCYANYEDKMQKILSDDEMATTSHREEARKLIKRIVQLSHSVSTQIVKQTHSRYEEFTARKLRSRQRNTYRRMLDSLLTIWCGLRLIQLICIATMLESTLSISESDQQSVVRLLKSILQYCENLLTYTNADKNKWEEAVLLTSDITSKILTS